MNKKGTLLCFVVLAFCMMLIVQRNKSNDRPSAVLELQKEDMTTSPVSTAAEVATKQTTLLLPYDTQQEQTSQEPSKGQENNQSASFEDEKLLRIISPATSDLSKQLQSDQLNCPYYRWKPGKSADSKSNSEHIAKYTRYVSTYCNESGLLQMHFGLNVYVNFLDIVARITRIKNNSRIFDWGCGCGTLLNYFAMKFNTSGVGIDITFTAIEHARRYSRPHQTYCHLDGSHLKHWKDNSFDSIVSWATLYHVRRTLVQCTIVHELVRMLKPGGIAYIGHLRTEKTQEYWKKKNKCRIPGATLVRYRDYKTFHMPAFRRNQFFSLVITKMSVNSSVVPSENPEEES